MGICQNTTTFTCSSSSSRFDLCLNGLKCTAGEVTSFLFGAPTSNFPLRYIPSEIGYFTNLTAL